MRVVICALVVLLASGCVVTPTFVLEDSKTDGIVLGDVLSANCVKHGNANDWKKYRLAASRLLSVSKVNTSFYNSQYVILTNHINAMEKTKFEQSCYDYAPKMAAQANAMEKDYQYYLYRIDEDRRRQAELWSAAITAMAAVTVAFADGISNAGSPVYIPMPSGQVTFGNGATARNPAYLVNTPSGLRRCTVSGASFVFCN